MNILSRDKGRHDLIENYNPDLCIHCGSRSTSGVSIHVMTAENKLMGREGEISKHRFSHFIPLDLALCEKCVRATARDEKSSRSMIPGVLLGIGALIPVAVWLIGEFHPFLFFVALGVLIGFPLSIRRWYQTRKINPDLDPLDHLVVLFRDNDGLLTLHKEDVEKAVLASRGRGDTHYWSIKTFDEEIRPKMEL